MMLGERDQLQEALHALRGAVVKGVTLGAGEVFLEFEQPRDGVWSLGTGGSRWALIHDDEPVVTDADDPEALRRFDLAVGLRVLDLRPGKDTETGHWCLRVDLEEGVAFFIAGAYDSAPDLPVFEFLSPAHRMVALYSDGTVDDVPDDVPIPGLIASGPLHRWPSDEND
jgi:hypothetical protein